MPSCPSLHTNTLPLLHRIRRLTSLLPTMNSARNFPLQRSSRRNYTLGKVIGEGIYSPFSFFSLNRLLFLGTYGKVRLGTHRLTTSRVAIKQIPKALSATLTREIHHIDSFIILTYSAVRSYATENSIWLVTELCSEENCSITLRRKAGFGEETRQIFGQLCLAVNICTTRACTS